MSQSMSKANGPTSLMLTEDLQNRLLEAQLRTNRSQLHNDIIQNNDTAASVTKLMATDCPPNQRYDVLDFVLILQANSQTLVDLQMLPVAFTILEKYGRHLMRPPKDRSSQWKLIKYKNPIFAEKVDVIEGGRVIMNLLGYTVDIGDGLAFPDGVEPDPNRLVRLVADILLAKREVEAIIKGDHPNKARMDSLLSQNARYQLQKQSTPVTKPNTPLMPPSNTIKPGRVPPAIPSRDLKPVYNTAKVAASEPQNTGPIFCDICGEKQPEKICDLCDSKQLCESCDEKWHRHPKRQDHKRVNIPTVQHPPTQSIRVPPPGGGQTFDRSLTPGYPGNEMKREPSSPGSDESFYSTEESNPLEMHSHDLDAEAGAVMPNLSIFKSESERQGASALGGHAALYQEGPPKVGSSAAGAIFPPPLPEVFQTNYKAPRADIRQQLAELDNKILVKENELTSLIVSSPSFYEDPQYIFLTRDKDLLLRKKFELTQKMDSLDKSQDGSKVINQGANVPQGLQDQPVFYPPTVPPSLTSEEKSQPQLHVGQPHLPSTGTPFFSPKLHSSESQPQLSNIQPQVRAPPSYRSALQPHVLQVQSILSQSSLIPLSSYNPALKSSSLPPKKRSLQSPPTQRNPAGEKFGSLPRATKAQPQPELSQLKFGTLVAQQPSQTEQEVTVLLGNRSVRVPSVYTLGPSQSLQLQQSVAEESTPGGQGRTSFTQKWECDHCTFVNDPGPNICVICQKTSDFPKLHPENEVWPEVPVNWNSNVESAAGLSGAAGLSTSLGERTRLVYEEAETVMREKKEAQMRYNAWLQQQGESESEQNLENSEREQQDQLNLTTTSLECHGSHPDLGALDTSSSTMEGGNSPRTPAAIQRLNEAEKLAIDGKKVISLLRQADIEGFSPEELQIAMEVCGDQNPIDWLKEMWPGKIQSVITLTTATGQSEAQNEIGELSSSEAKEVLTRNMGNVAMAAEACIQERKRKFQMLSSEGAFPGELILEVLKTHHGNVDKALTDLHKEELRPYLNRIWDNPNNGQPEALRMAVALQEHDYVANSVIDHEEFQEKVQDSSINIERRVRMVLVESKLQSWGRAQAVIRILTSMPDENFTLHDVIEAVRNCGDVQSSISYLQQECEICFSKYPMSKIRNFTLCQCKICVECLSQHLELVIREQFIRNWACPVCQRPDIQQDDEAATEHFGFLDMLLPTMVSKEVRDLFQVKLRDWKLMQDPNFRWCAHCGNGFIFNGDQLKMPCLSCKQHTCFKCKRPWEVQHEGLSCEQFQQWKLDNDPESQATGLARHLDENGIVCPSCKMRYALAKGGCMHFKCPQCGHEFCNGCNLPFRRSENCNKFQWCRNQGLHCHHPRDCLFYLRDHEVEELQGLLEKHKVVFNKDPPQGQGSVKKCAVMEQKEDLNSRKDEPCGKKVERGHAGLCHGHYKEYLVGLINMNKIDPVTIMSLERIKSLFQKMDKEAPSLGTNENPEQYHQRLIQIVMKKIPLMRLDSRGGFQQM